MASSSSTTTAPSPNLSAFLSPGLTTKEGYLASLHLSHNQSLPVILSTVAATVSEQGYAEGVVTNTKFGSFPHSTLLNIPWGSQVRASKVDTGSRGRNPALNLSGRGSKKRKADAISSDSPASTPVDIESPSAGAVPVKEATTATSGYIHVLPPTPENWTTSLPHRTQVVYTPDYSYVLHRIRARPGSVLLEAGSGSGSFTHAAVRAVYDGNISGPGEVVEVNGGVVTVSQAKEEKKKGRVYTFEFHPERHEKVKIEMDAHGLGGLVIATHRDVYKDGFWLRKEDGNYESPNATAVFLDLPAPWEALPHLSRSSKANKPSVLDPACAAHICTFSPCIEQAQKTISAMRKLGWVEIEMVEIQHKRIDVRREFTGLKYDGMRSVNVYAADVDEAVSKLRMVEQRAKAFHAVSGDEEVPVVPPVKRQKSAQNIQMDASRAFYKEGSIVHRSEPELKTHTSYLVFAILPREWTAEDEEQARDMLNSNIKAAPPAPKSQRQLKKEAKARKKQLANGTSKGSGQAESAKE